MSGFIFGGGGGGGGSGSDPTKVLKAGDTMTGALVIRGDNFDANIVGAGTAVPGVQIQSTAGGDPVGICIGQFGGEGINFIRGNGAQANIRMPGGLIHLTYPGGPLVLSGGGSYIFDCNDSGGFHLQANCDSSTGDFKLSSKVGFGLQLSDGTRTTRLTIDANGDLVAKNVAGANAGKAISVSNDPYDIGLYMPGKPSASITAMRFVFVRPTAFTTNLGGSVANAGTAAAASTTFNIAKNGSNIGTLVFASAGTSGTFTVAAAPSFVSGDILTIVAPATPDTALADISVTLSGTRSWQ